MSSKPWDSAEFVNAGGLRWHVRRAGNGPLILLIHGTASSTHTWEGMVPQLARNHSVLALDLPGHGLTASGGAQWSSISGMSAGVASLLDELSLRPKLAVGHSAGAVILCRMALDARIAPAVIVSINGAFVPLGGLGSVMFAPLARVLCANSWLPRFVARRAADPGNVARLIAGTGSRLHGDAVESYASLVRDPKHVAGALSMMGHWNLDAFARALPALSTPLALIVAQNDRAIPPRQAEMVLRTVRTASLHPLTALGHLAHEESPQSVAALVLHICASFSGPVGASADPSGRPSVR